MTDAPWWRSAVVYQIYPRSFADSDGDGIGDLPGIIDRVDHLARLGADAVWLSPIYPSPLADAGYDVGDYRNVDPVGQPGRLRRAVAALHGRGIRLVMDLVVDRHQRLGRSAVRRVALGPGERQTRNWGFGRPPRSGNGAGAGRARSRRTGCRLCGTRLGVRHGVRRR